MKKIILVLSLCIAATTVAGNLPFFTNPTPQVMKNTPQNSQTIYQFKVTDLYSNEFDFASLKGKKIMIVNTASECGLTPQYKQLQSMYEEFGGDNFVIV